MTEVEEESFPLLAWEKELEEEGFTLVRSSAFRAFCYEDGEDGFGKLTVQFQRGIKTPDIQGSRWIYDVPRETFEKLLSAEHPDSMGKFFFREIRGNCNGHKVEPKP